MIKKVFFLALLFLVSNFSYAAPCVTEKCFIEHTLGNKLNIPDSEISKSDLPVLLKYLNQHKEINEINLSYMPGEYQKNGWDYIRDDGAVALAKAKYITKINLSSARITETGTKALSENPRIVELNLAFNQISNMGIAHLAKLPKLRFLNINYNRLLTDEALFALSSAKSLEKLEINTFISPSIITNAGVIHIVNLPKLQSLSLAGRNIDEQIANTIVKNGTIEKLDLSSNHMGDNIATILSQSQSIKSLNLRANELGNLSIKALAKNKYLQHLNIDYNEITDESATFLAENQTLESLSIAGNYGLGEDAIIYMIDHMSIHALNMSELDISTSIASAIALSKTINQLEIDSTYTDNRVIFILNQNKNLKKLSVVDNEITDQGAFELANNSNLEYLDIRYNRLGTEGVLALEHSNIKNSLTWPQY